MRIAIDTGGTFTDCVYRSGGALRVLKISSTPADPAEAVLSAIAAITAGRDEIERDKNVEVLHGTTVGTNALLERKGARTALVTTAGFEDALAIGRQARPRLYDWFYTPEPPLAPQGLRFGISERVTSEGTILRSVDPQDLERLHQSIRDARAESVAVSLLFSFANPANEQAVVCSLRSLGIPVSASHEILPEFREYERASTVVINAYLAPKMQNYVGRLKKHLEAADSRLFVMQSSGGITPAAIAEREPVRTILSGPAGGVVGALHVARSAGFNDILTFDMGGTSTDVALVQAGSGVGTASLATTTESKILGMPVAVPTLEINTVGAGGGSLAGFDRGGALKVGPESAGADPGPVCYGRGTTPTVTDANLVLGRLDEDHFLGGNMRLDLARARHFCDAAKQPLPRIEDFAEGVIRLADSHMEKALRKISIERGLDPRDFALVSFGGAGPLHACALARALRIPKVLVPQIPGALSAFGILVSDIVRDYSRTVMLNAGDREALMAHFNDLERLAGPAGLYLRSLDVRYAGQGYELAVDWCDDFPSEFHRQHQSRYGYSDLHRSVEVVNARLRCVTPTEADAPVRHPCTPNDGANAVVKSKPIYCDGEWRQGLLYDRPLLTAGAVFEGPALVVEYSATTFVPPRSLVRVDEYLNLMVEVNP
ncbi:MAG TPA: hydantoinase/oxoprolinase family protein [Bryobacteraceae bacterium]|jgi:N-methylhydantoinase A|nr:hydantoinase/oxoprolinase family protein [Bryobacteraceae bacterium]